MICSFMCMNGNHSELMLTKQLVLLRPSSPPTSGNSDHYEVKLLRKFYAEFLQIKSDLESIQSDDDKKYEKDDVEFLGYSYDPTNVKQEEVEFIGYVINEGKCTLHYAFWL